MSYSKKPFRITPLINALLIQILLVLITLLVIVIFIILLPLWLSFFAFRQVLKFHVKRFRPDLGSIVTVRSTIQAVDTIDVGNRTTVVLPLIFSGTIDITKFREDIYKKLNERDADVSLKYPELQQSLFNYRGYAFWKWDKEFKIENHVLIGNEKSNKLDADGLNKIAAKLIRKPFHKERSPWDITLFSDYQKKGCTKPRSLAIVRFSHALVDARSAVQMLMAMQPESEKTQKAEEIKPGFWARFGKALNTAVNLILCPYQLVVGVYEGSDWNAFTYRESKDFEPMFVKYGDPVSIRLIKEIKNKLNGTFEGVVVAAYTAGLRKAMLANNVEIPFAVHGMQPQPMGGHKDSFRNLMKYGLLRLPVGIADPEERRKYIENHLKELKHGRLSSQLYYLFLGVGVLPIYWVHLSVKLCMFQSSIISNVAFPFKELKYGEHVLEEFKFSAGYRPGRTWFGIASLSYGDHLQIQTNFPRDTIFHKNKDAFLDGILEEFQIMASTHLV